MVNAAVIGGIGSAFPPSVRQDEMWQRFFKQHFANDALARRMFESVGVEQRHAVANPIEEDLSSWSTQKRMQKYLPEAMPLAVDAVRKALSDASLNAADVGLLVISSCTGYASPGIEALLPEAIGMGRDVRRVNVGHMGCFAALPGLSVANDYVIANQKSAVLLSVELCSLHVQPPTSDTEQVVAHALFSDAAAAVVVQPFGKVQNQSFEVIDFEVSLYPDASSLMTWDVTDFGFRMGLSQRIPDVLAQNVDSLVNALLSRSYLSLDSVSAWAVHPGGPRILDVVEERLKLKSDTLSPSRRVLSEHGNCSSATLLLVLDEVRQSCELNSGDHVVAMAFGPGLTLYAGLLRVVSSTA